MLCCLYFVCCILQDMVKRRFFFYYTVNTLCCILLDMFNWWITMCMYYILFFYTLNIVFCRICLIVESPYITFFIYFVCCISQDWACSMGKYLCITVFIYFVVCYSILPDIFNRSISINQTLLTIAMSVVFLKKWSKRNISMSDNLFTI